MKKEKVEEKEIKETTAKAKIKEDIDKKIVVKNQSEEKNETKPVKKTTKSKKEDSSNQKEEEKKEEVKSENPHKNKVMNILKNAKEKGNITYGELAAELGDVDAEEIDKVFEAFE